MFLSGNFDANVSLQCSPSTASIPAAWFHLGTYNNIGAKLIDTGIACSLRAGIAIGNYTSGTCNLILQTGGRP